MLGAYQLSADELYLDKATAIGKRLYAAFNSPSGLPYSIVNLKSGKGWNPSWTNGANLLSEVGSVQLEFKALSYFTNDPKYYRAADKVIDIISTFGRGTDANGKPSPPNGMWPVYVNGESRSFTSGTWRSSPPCRRRRRRTLTDSPQISSRMAGLATRSMSICSSSGSKDEAASTTLERRLP